MNRYFIHNQEYENALGKVNNKMKISFIGALKILEQSGYGLGGKDFITSSKYQVDIFSSEQIKGIEKNDIVLIAASSSVKNDVLLLQECRKLADIPIVVLGKNDEKYSINMLYSGADDYLKLPCSRQVLDTVIYIHIRREHR